jgi:hypothetical protein
VGPSVSLPARGLSGAGKVLPSEAISDGKKVGLLPCGILESLRNNSVCHKWPQSGSGAAESMKTQFQTIPVIGDWRYVGREVALSEMIWRERFEAGE